MNPIPSLSNSPMTALVTGVGVIAPGLLDWACACAVLRDEQPHVSAPSVLTPPEQLPAPERRRASRVVKLALGLGLQAVQHAQADASTLATVFAASGADGHNCHALCEQLAGEDRQISPTRFHNSVHNAAAGYWGIASRSMAPCQVIGAFDASFGAGLLDALAQVALERRPVLLIAYDSEYPQPLQAKRPTPDCAGVALVLSPCTQTAPQTPGAQALGQLSLVPTESAAHPMGQTSLEALRQSIPAMRALPLLRLMARAEPATVVLDYLPPMQLELQWRPL